MTAILPQGPLILGPVHTVAGLPLLSKTIRQPGPLVVVVPSLLGVLPTITQPLLSIVIAVASSPTPPGHCARSCGSFAKVKVFRVDGL